MQVFLKLGVVPPIIRRFVVDDISRVYSRARHVLWVPKSHIGVGPERHTKSIASALHDPAVTIQRTSTFVL